MKHVKKFKEICLLQFRGKCRRITALVLSASLVLGILPFQGEALVRAAAETTTNLLKFNNTNLEWKQIETGAQIFKDRTQTFLQMPSCVDGAYYVYSGLDSGNYNDVTVSSACWLYVMTPPLGQISSQAKTLEAKGYERVNTAPFLISAGFTDEIVIYEKYCGKGETLSLGKFAMIIPSTTRITNWSGPLVPDNEMAILESTSGVPVGNIRYGAKVFSDRDFTFDDYPAFLAGKNVIQSNISAGLADQIVRATRAGMVYVATPKSSLGTSMSSRLISQGFTKVDIPNFQYYYTTEESELYCKQLAVGDTFSYNRLALPIFSGELQTSEMAVLEPGSGSESAKLRQYEHIFTTREFILSNELPAQLNGKSFIRGSIETGGSATVRQVLQFLPSS